MIVPTFTNENQLIILYIVRRGTRCIQNSENIIHYLTAICKRNDYNLIIHDDYNRYSIDTQILHFSKAHIVIGAHGAGLLFITFSPINACVIELMPIKGEILCYARLAYLRKLSYVMKTMKILPNSKKKCYFVKLLSLFEALNSCPILHSKK